MSYYMGDYYGNRSFYRGDPGFFGFIGRALKGVVKLATGLGGGGPKLLPPITTFPGGPAVTGIQRVGPILRKLPGALKKIPRGVLVGAGAAAAGAAAGAGARRLMEGGRKRRRMNVCNSRALRRAIRRSQGFARLAKRVLRFTSPKAPRGRAVFKTRRRKRI